MEVGHKCIDKLVGLTWVIAHFVEGFSDDSDFIVGRSDVQNRDQEMEELLAVGLAQEMVLQHKRVVI